VDKKPLISKYLSIGIILLFIGTYSIPAVAQSQDDNQSQGIIFNLMFVMTVSWSANETSKPISPGETREVNITITYLVTRGIYGRLLLQLLKGKSFPLQLSIENKSD